MSESKEHIEEMRNEVANVLQMLDELTETWGDSWKFRRCRDRLRKLLHIKPYEIRSLTSDVKVVDLTVMPTQVVNGVFDASQCKFSIAWRGWCGKPATSGDKCETHAAMKCCVCGQPATRECPYEGMFTCGYPLCGSCSHGDPYGHVRSEK